MRATIGRHISVQHNASRGVVTIELTEEAVLGCYASGCAFLIGGCGFDDEGPALYRVEGDGSAAESQFATMGSGQMAAAAVLEATLRRQPEPSPEFVIEAVRAAVEAGIRGDTGSGGHVDVVFIGEEETRRYRFAARP